MVDYKKSTHETKPGSVVLISTRGRINFLSFFFLPPSPLFFSFFSFLSFLFFFISFFSSSGQTGPSLLTAFSICNADKMEIPERICKSSADVIGFVAANDESDPFPSDDRVIFRVFVFHVSTFFFCLSFSPPPPLSLSLFFVSRAQRMRGFIYCLKGGTIDCSSISISDF